MLDNNGIRYNIRIKNIKEEVEGQDSEECLYESFQNILGSKNNLEIKIEATYRVGIRRAEFRKP